MRVDLLHLSDTVVFALQAIVTRVVAKCFAGCRNFFSFQKYQP